MELTLFYLKRYSIIHKLPFYSILYKKLVLSLLSISLCLCINAQTEVISGVLLDSDYKPISQATVLLYKTSDSLNFYKFRISDINGEFEFNLNKVEATVSYYIAVKHLNYNDKESNVDKNKTLTLFLEQRTNELREVTINADKSLQINGDTLSYAVSQWKDKKDISIEDVIKRIPGVEVDDRGFIKYDGNYINHLYINGVDVLENRYTIATKGLPAGVVKNIEVLKRHSHKLINNATNKSKGVALNLVTTKKNLLAGIAKAQIADPIINGSINATPLFINPKSQIIGSLKATSLGDNHLFNDRSISILDLGQPEPELDFIDYFQFYREQRSNLKNQYWRDTYTGNSSLDYLTNNKENELFKIGYSTDFDQVNIENTFEEIIQLGDDNITNLQVNDVTSITRNHYLKGYYEINNLESYMKIDFYARSFHNDQHASTLINNVEFNRDLKNTGNTIYSGIQYDKNTSLGLLTTDGTLQIKQTDGKLLIDRSVFDVLQTGASTGAFQDINTQESFLQVKTGVYNDIKNGSIEFQLQGDHRKQELSSDFGFNNDNSYEFFPFENLQKYATNKLHFKTGLHQTWGKLILTLKTDLYYNDITSEDSSQQSEKVEGLYIEPIAYLSYNRGLKWGFSISSSVSNTFSDIRQTPTSFLMTDFNSSLRFENRIQETRNYNIGINARYKDIVNGLFFNLAANSSKLNNKLLSSVAFDEQGFRISSFEDQDNSNSLLNLETSLSKTIGKSINLKVKASFNEFINMLLLNEQLSEFKSHTYNLNFEATYDSLDWYYIVAKAGFFSNQSQVVENNLVSYSYDTNVIFGQQWGEHHFTELTWNGQRNILLNSDNYNNLFDFRYVWKLKSDREMNFQIVNIGNQKRFVSINSSSNITSINSFPLLGRQFILSYKFFF